MGIKLYAKQTAMLGLRGGGQIAAGMLDEYVDNGLKRLYCDSLLLKLPVYITQTADQKRYTIPDPAISELADDRVLLRLNTVGYDDDTGLNEDPDDINTRSEIAKNKYGVVSVIDSLSVAWKLELTYKPAETVNNGLELVQAYSSTSDDYVPGLVAGDAREALRALVRHSLLAETGKPWTEPQLAAQELGMYMAHMGRIRIAAERDFNHGDLVARPAVGFII